MWAILSVFRKEFRENLRDRRTLISALIFGPLFGPLLFAAGLSLSIERGTAESDRPVMLAASNGRSIGRVKALFGQYSSVLARLRMAARGIDPLVLAPIVVHDVDVSTPA